MGFRPVALSPRLRVALMWCEVEVPIMNNSMLEEDNRTALDLIFPDFSGTDESSGYAKGFKYMRRRVWNAAALGIGDAVAISLALLLAGAVRKLWFGASMIPIWG